MASDEQEQQQPAPSGSWFSGKPGMLGLSPTSVTTLVLAPKFGFLNLSQQPRIQLQSWGVFRPLAFRTAGALTNVSVTAIATTTSLCSSQTSASSCSSLRFPASESQPHLDVPVTQFASQSTERAGST